MQDNIKSYKHQRHEGKFFRKKGKYITSFFFGAKILRSSLLM